MSARLDEREAPCSECGLFEACNECTELGGDYDDDFESDFENDFDFEDDDYSYPDGIATQRESMTLEKTRWCGMHQAWEKLSEHGDH